MTKEIIALALEAEGLKGGTHGFNVPEDREATCMVSAPGDLYTVSRVVVFDLREKYLLLQTSRDERFVFAYEDVLGLRLLGRAQAKERSAGFSR
jgi:hypothetical protein